MLLLLLLLLCIRLYFELFCKNGCCEYDILKLKLYTYFVNLVFNRSRRIGYILPTTLVLDRNSEIFQPDSFIPSLNPLSSRPA